MQQFKFSLEQPEINFLENFQLYGYRDKSSLVRAALEYFQKILEESNFGNRLSFMLKFMQKKPICTG